MLSIGILGTGAVGSLMAFHWQHEHLFALPKVRSSIQIKVQPLNSAEPLWMQKIPCWQGERLDWLVVATKAADTLTALSAWRENLPQCKNILLIQNGMGQQQQVADWLAEQDLNIPLWAAMCTEGAYRQNDTIIYAGAGKTLVGGWQHNSNLSIPLPPKLELVANIAEHLQQKLAINAVINPLTGYYRCPNGELVSNADYQQKLIALSEEIAGLYQALGWPLSQPLAEHVQQVALATANNRSSTLQDIEASRNTELAYINGYLLEQAATIGYPLPLNKKFYDLLA